MDMIHIYIYDIYIYDIYIYISYIYGSKTKKKTGDTNSFGEFSMWGWI